MKTSEQKRLYNKAYKARGKHPCSDCGKLVGKKSKLCRSCCQKLEKNHSWKGGRMAQSDGYVYIKATGHPCADKKGYILEHRLVMEAHLGRTLLPTEVVHHINGIRDDNRIENLMRFNSISDHIGHHDKLLAGWRKPL